MIEHQHSTLSIRSQCDLLQLGRSTLYYKQKPIKNDTDLANDIHDLWLKMPFYGYRKIAAELNRQGHEVNHKKVLRIMQEMNIQALYPTPNTSTPNKEHKIYPYLLKNMPIIYPNQAWCTDITYIKLPGGFMYLVSLLDIYSRFILSWEFSNTLDKNFCLDMLKRGLQKGKPEILNTDQGCQFTSNAWIEMVEKNGIRVSMDGVGRWADNIYIERFWRTVKYEHVFLHSFETMNEATRSIGQYIEMYNTQRLHQSLGYKTPAEMYLI